MIFHLRFSIYLIILSFVLIAFAQLPQPSAQQLFDAKNYAAYLTDLSSELSPGPSGAPDSFSKLAMVIVALDKTQGWDRNTGVQARDLLANDALATRQFAVLHALLGKDVKPIVALWADRKAEPDFPSSLAASKTLREHGYPAAADVVLTLARDLSPARIIAWASIPEAERPAIDAYMLKMYKPKGQNRRALLNLAVDLFLKPATKSVPGAPAAGNAVDPQKFYQLVLLLGQDSGLLDCPLAQRFMQAGKMAEAKALLVSLVREHPGDVLLPRQAAMVLGGANDPAAVDALYRQALAEAHEPYAREIRLDYLEYLQGLAMMRRYAEAAEKMPPPRFAKKAGTAEQSQQPGTALTGHSQQGGAGGGNETGSRTGFRDEGSPPPDQARRSP